ncbi:hypothetical protein [Roseovarius Plymouth podovirus 1]|uniref:Lipoprotein n=2 Tax=Roseovarius Plymouth podovirus 1 TaxID=926474 RepID=K4Q559_9CAUD|nr:site-specific recombination directionality factor RDF [Roseovarius Plymouth podovirus 1]CBW47031.1 hypothetical protein [Roseovarius sp. 217 phage 1]CBX87968.1 hypothetical protein [Roseovarius Plymouth podovirus 1]
MKRLLMGAAAIASAFVLAGCQTDATKASYNLSQAADNFEIVRRVVFYNGITGEYMLEVTGLCSISDQGNQLELTCKEGDAGYVKHFLGLSDNVTYFAEQVSPESVSVYHTRIIWKPQSIIPDIDLQFNGEELIENQNSNG